LVKKTKGKVAKYYLFYGMIPLSPRGSKSRVGAISGLKRDNVTKYGTSFVVTPMG
jgi:hypothetical protein